LCKPELLESTLPSTSPQKRTNYCQLRAPFWEKTTRRHFVSLNSDFQRRTLADDLWTGKHCWATLRHVT